jgi:hypothetical protein
MIESKSKKENKNHNIVVADNALMSLGISVFREPISAAFCLPLFAYNVV